MLNRIQWMNVMHDAAHNTSRIKSNLYLIKDKYNKENNQQEIEKRCLIIEKELTKLNSLLDSIYKQHNKHPK